MKKTRKLTPEDEDRPPAIDPRQTGLQPIAHRVLVNSEQLRDLLHRVAAVDFDAPRVQPLHVEGPSDLVKTATSFAIIPLAPMAHPHCHSAKRAGLYARQKSCQLCGDGQVH
jgi:hypothetical protein